MSIKWLVSGKLKSNPNYLFSLIKAQYLFILFNLVTPEVSQFVRNSTNIDISGHFNVPLIAPVGTPGIFDQPIILAFFGSIPHNQNRMVSGFGTLNISIDTHTFNLVSVGLWNFKDGGSLEKIFFAKNQYSQR